MDGGLDKFIELMDKSKIDKSVIISTEGNKFIGKTLRGTPLSINEKVYNSKIKIGSGGNCSSWICWLWWWR